jgi:hypothetical protein
MYFDIALWQHITPITDEEYWIFKETYYIIFLWELEKWYPKVFNYLTWKDTEERYMSDLGLPYILIADITHYLEKLHQKWDMVTIQWILTMFDSMLQSGKVWRDHILCSFIEIVWHYPDLLKWILPILPESLKNETLKYMHE